MKKLSLEDWIFYRTLAYWEALEASCLLNGIDPESIDSEIPKGIGRILSSIERSVRSREIDFKPEEIAESHPFFKHREKWSSFIDEPNDSYYPDYMICTFNPYTFLGWADKRGFPIQGGFDGWEEGRFTMNTPEGTKAIFNDFSSESSGINQNSLIKSEAPPLTTPESQELGRLRKESDRLIKSLDAAVFLGYSITTSDVRMTKTKIREILENRFPHIDKQKTVIDQLWDSLPNGAKNTGGNSKDPMPDHIWPDINTEIKK